MGAKQSKRSPAPAPPSSIHRPPTDLVSEHSVATSSPRITVDGRVYHNIENSSYFFPRDEQEQDRLNSQHFAIKALFGTNLLPSAEQAMPSDAKVLDVGCGPGSWVMEMAVDYPNAHFTGIDISDIFPTTIRPDNVSFELVNVLDGLPFDDNSFDLVHMRFLFTAIRTDEWTRVLNEIYRVLKPGGILQWGELDLTEATQSPFIERFASAFHSIMQERQQDPWIAYKLESTLNQHQFEIVEQTKKKIQYGRNQDAIAQEMLWVWSTTLQSLRPLVIAKLCPEDPTQYESLVQRYLQDCTDCNWFMQVWFITGRKL
ncbi:hypothetical protein EC973_002138 [Apophysomyces ossiformis]|uniref:Methyltransferase domain-containing protein n=1 Tax=Apophysomyces ossiformis TaxID=679940 RepID=A0A8H7BP67_9FUNG|nr:hypothetical protein EC973_002138 [Apophysomyces ossiformis]